MRRDNAYASVMARRAEIMRRSVGIDYDRYELDGGIAFDYEALAASPPYAIDDVRRIQRQNKVGDTPLLELRRLSELVRSGARAGMGARIFVKDEAANAAGSFKARRASMCLAQAAEQACRGVIAATSGNYGAAIASQAAMYGLKALILQEVFDSTGRGQPEVLEKTRACEAYGAEVWQLTVGPELFFIQLLLLEETGYFNASLYTPYATLGVETLGYEIALECVERFGRQPAAVVATHSGGGNITGTARGLRRGGADGAALVGVSVDLTGLHMASDRDFNRKSFTTGHTGFGIPFSVDPDRVDVPRNAARGLRYLDRYVTVTQGEVFYATQCWPIWRAWSAAPPATPRSRRHWCWRESSARTRSSSFKKRNTPAPASTRPRNSPSPGSWASASASDVARTIAPVSASSSPAASPRWASPTSTCRSCGARICGASQRGSMVVRWRISKSTSSQLTSTPIERSSEMSGIC